MLRSRTICSTYSNIDCTSRSREIYSSTMLKILIEYGCWLKCVELETAHGCADPTLNTYRRSVGTRMCNFDLTSQCRLRCPKTWEQPSYYRRFVYQIPHASFRILTRRGSTARPKPFQVRIGFP